MDPKPLQDSFYKNLRYLKIIRGIAWSIVICIYSFSWFIKSIFVIILANFFTVTSLFAIDFVNIYSILIFTLLLSLVFRLQGIDYLGGNWANTASGWITLLTIYNFFTRLLPSVERTHSLNALTTKEEWILVFPSVILMIAVYFLHKYCIKLQDKLNYITRNIETYLHTRNKEEKDMGGWLTEGMKDMAMNRLPSLINWDLRK